MEFEKIYDVLLDNIASKKAMEEIKNKYKNHDSKILLELIIQDFVWVDDHSISILTLKEEYRKLKEGFKQKFINETIMSFQEYLEQKLKEVK